MTYQTLRDLPYHTAQPPAIAQHERCRLDLHYPTDQPGYATLVWFHGGGLTNGNRELPPELLQQGIAVAGAGYRLSPEVRTPCWIEDAAAAVAWTLRHIAEYGGDPQRVFVGGHSAGGYLAAMVGLDKRWLAPHQLDPDQLAGLLPLSAQLITHFMVRQERGLGPLTPVIDDLAPLYHLRADAPPICLITGDRELDVMARQQENAYCGRMLRLAGHPDVEVHEMTGCNHGEMLAPAFPLALRFIQRLAATPSHRALGPRHQGN